MQLLYYIILLEQQIRRGKMNEIVRTYIISLEMHLPTQDTMSLIRKIAGTYRGLPFYIQPFTGNA
ncbi:MAG: hypothetical protein HZA12_01285 [Nitrospirae bacterium]|nr:hypothetical protein [Nitrospirota bacterium]